MTTTPTERAPENSEIVRPRVTIAVQGRFHAFQLAKTLQDHHHLQRLITSYPVFETVKYGVAPSRIRSLVAYELASWLWRRAPGAIRRIHDVNMWIRHGFDWHASRIIEPDTDIFIGWSGNAYRSIRRARARGMLGVVERGSAHMLTQIELMREEFELNGRPFVSHHPAITEAELKEYAESDYIAIPSSFARRTFLNHGVPEEKLLINPYGVDAERFSPGPKEDDVFRVIYCGALSIRKGIVYLLRAFRELNLPNSELWLIGNRQADTEAIMAQHAAPNIRHMGPFPEFKLPRYYRQGSVFCLPSVEDGFAMVLNQAMACGLPIVATTNSGGPDLVSEDREGFVVPIRDVDALKEKLLFMYENPELRAEMGRAARRRIETAFTWDAYGERAIEHYRRIHAARRPAP